MSNPTPSHFRIEEGAQDTQELQPLPSNHNGASDRTSLLSELEQPYGMERDPGHPQQDSISRRSSTSTATTSRDTAPQIDMVEEQVEMTTHNGPPTSSTNMLNTQPDGNQLTTATLLGQTKPAKNSWHRRLLQSIQRFWRYRWVAEWLSCALAFVSLGAIIALLIIRQGQPIPRWRANITINALLSLFLVLLKAGLALPLSEGINQLKWKAFRQHPRPLIDMEDFDAASRGAWGSFHFIFKLDKEDLGSSSNWIQESIQKFFNLKSQNSTYYMAKWGALLVILAFAADPFVQQVVQFIPCPQNSTSLTASVPRTMFFDLRGYRQGPGLEYIQAPMQVAIQRALYDPPINPGSLISATCKSGNCSFPLFSTLGFCHSCEDISSKVRNVTTGSRPVFNLTVDDDGNDLSIGEDPNGFVYFMAVGSTSRSIPNISSPSWTVSMLSGSITDGEPNGKIPPSAFKCDLTTCVRTHKATILNNVPTEELVSSTLFTGIPTSAITSTSEYFRFATKRILDKHSAWSNCTPLDAAPIDNGTYSAVFEVSVEGAAQVPPDMISTSYKWVPKDCIWTIGVTPLWSIHNELTAKFAEIEVRASTWFAGGPVPGMTLWRNGTGDLNSTTSVMGVLANVLTNALRQNGGDGPAAYAEGTVAIEDTCAVVDWRWVSFLFVLTILAEGFFILMWCKARKTPDNRIWKSSSLLVLRCNLEDKVRDRLGTKLTRDAIMERATEIRVELNQDDEDKPRFVLTG